VPEHFADRLAALVEERRSRVVLGLDPDPARLWPGSADSGAGGDIAAATAEAVARHCRAAIEAAGPACVAVKPQLACFERLGAPGWAALAATRDAAHEHGLLVLADGKRGDVPVTAAAYAQALVGSTPGPHGPVPGLGADCFTVNPLLGRDSLEPLVDAAAQAGACCFVLVSTSNPGAADLQDLDAGGRPVHEHVAALVDDVGAGHVGACGLSLVGAVTGATRPERLARLRELMPRAVFLLPGVGAQGGDPGALGAAFSPHPAAGLVTASRSIVNAYTERGGDPAAAAAAAAQELRHTTWNL
jgi:orotidine-5'-phosphate decarboxylase